MSVDRWDACWLRVMILLCLCGAMLGGCGDDDGDSDAHSDEDGHHQDAHDAGHEGDHDASHGDNHTTCGLQENCIDTLDLSEGLEVEGEDGVFTVTVEMHNHLSILDNEWLISVADADGEKVEDATVTVRTFSVDCMHGGPTEAEMVTANDDGDYEVAPVNGHGGPWNTILEVESGDDNDTVTLNLCIPGASHGGAGGDAGGMHDAGASEHEGHGE